ncbi:MAG: RtcB family protein [Chloroflexota bacterium]|nr:RtcB family protein [Chloroflexota bacterium]MDQ5867364.1 RtcB family protein [Chloroflexota bacterium]
MKKKEKTQLAQAMAAQRKAQEERQARKDKPERAVTLVGWKQYAVANEEGYYDLRTEDTGEVPVRLFLTPKLLAEAEDILYAQIVNATQFPGVKMVIITPDVHYGYGVPVGSVILTEGTLAMGPVGYDIGCFTGDTLVPTVDGHSYTMEELAASGEEVLVYALSAEKKIVVARATVRKTRENAGLVKVTLDNEREIFCTPDHEFMLRDGSYRQAQNLKAGTTLMPFRSHTDRDGYTVVRHPGSENDQRVHWIMARGGLLGEIPSFPGQKTVIHHRDFTPTNNRIENLQFMGDRDHMAYHKSIRERNPHFQSEEFEQARVAALAAKAQTPEGYSYYAERGTRNILAYMENNPEHFKAAVAGNGERGKQYLQAYNVSPQGRARSSEIAHREHVCETCGDTVPGGGFGIHNHRRYKHGYNHKVVSVVPVDRREDVYCLTVPGYGNFALEAGVFVHNCGMVSARSNVPWPSATPEKRLEFNKAVMRRVAMGAGHSSKTALSKVSESEFNEIVRGGAEYYISKYGVRLDRSRAERNRIPVDDDWEIPWGGRGRPERGRSQLGSLGGGNHFMELQRCEETGTLFVQVHSGSRGFGHGLATNYFDLAKAEKPDKIKHLDMGYFTPDSPYHRSYLNAVAAGGNFAIVNRLVLYEQIAEAFEEVFGEELELIYEISHNLVQREPHPELGEVWVHRKGATRAFPAGHPNLEGTIWEETGHPVLIPGSNRDYSFILRPLPGAVKSGFSVNHGAGRRLSRGSARKGLDQKEVNRIYRESGVVVNANADVPLDESDACYKSSQEVVDAVVQAGLAEIQYRLWPLASLKGTD